jgi:hypothetical protein
VTALPPVRALRAAVAAGGALVLLAGCGTGSVEVPVPRPPTWIAQVCQGFRGRLPQKLHGRSRRTTTPTSPLVTAWGSPAIVVRCGVPRPTALHPTSDLVVINGVNWLPVPPDRPVTFTAVGRQVYVEVTVPAAYQPPGDVLIELGDAVKTIRANPDATL